MRKRFLGIWKLLSVETVVDGSLSYPYGEHPVGRLAYDDAGRMSVQIMKTGRQSPTDDGCLAYYGTFAVDEENQTVIHHLEACNIPAWIGTEQKRPFEFDGDHLVLNAPSTKLVWERLP
jgi:Lipocalin-like domain